ncbi:MAG: serine hydrolase domain-containing protein [Phycisphaerae bacterium]
MRVRLLVVGSLGSALFLASCAIGPARPTSTLANPDGHDSPYASQTLKAEFSPSNPTVTVDATTGYHRTFTLENWDDGGELSHFVYLHTSQFFRTAVIHRQGPVSKLEYHLDPSIGQFVIENMEGHEATLDEYMESAPLDGFIILHHGRIVYERYPRMRSLDKHLLFSVTKAFIGTLVSILEDRGLIDVSRSIDQYIPELRKTAWEGISVLDILDMSSGIEGHEIGAPFTDPVHKHYQMEASLGWLPITDAMPQSVIDGDTYAFLITLERRREPGTRWEYTSINTTMLGWLIERVTGKPMATLLSEEIWSRMGAEADAMIVVNRNGLGIAHAGMATTLRDLARFGLLFTESWRLVSEERIISDSHLSRITEGGRPHLLGEKHSAEMRHATRQWDEVTNGGSFCKDGFAGQRLWIAPRNDVVIAYLGTNESLRPEDAVELPLCKMTAVLFPEE